MSSNRAVKKPMSTVPPQAPDAVNLAVREQAVHEERVWVRTTYACNNRCIFCLDGDVPPRGHRSPDEIREEIRRRFVQGARLVISGGEASIHPDFLEFVRFGKQTGYHWIQTISNGRMFAYPSFARQAVENGLSEVTFSMHGHTRELHDTLTGVAGGFAQAIKGMTNLLREGIVVNVDVVINGMNYRHLDDILDFYMKLGIHEFDLLQVAPFGRAWWPENRERMFYDVGEAFPYLNKAFRRAFTPGVYLWTNRFPVAYLEGIEELIQDPHKLFDEMRGRRAEFDHFIDSGQMLACWPERCPHCFLQHYCAGLMALRKRLEQGDADVLEVDLRQEPAPPAGLLARFTRPGTLRGLRLFARDLRQAQDWLSAAAARPPALALGLDDWTDFLLHCRRKAIPECFPGLDTLIGDDIAHLDMLMELDVALEWRLTRESANALAFRREALLARGRLTLHYPSVETLSEAAGTLPDPVGVLESWREAPVRVRGLPPCIHPKAEPDPPTLRTSSLDAQGRIDMAAYTRDFIRHDYLAHSRRCAFCPARPGCSGLHINTIRVHRFAVLEPGRVSPKPLSG